MKYPKDIANLKFNRLSAVKFLNRDSRGRAKWLFKCDCGEDLVADKWKVCSGWTKSCGCYKLEETSKRSITHGCSRTGKHTKTYRTWESIKRRCLNPKQKSYHSYGGRGIKICDRWINSFESFLEDMGERPEGTSLDRIDNNGNYEPGNCRWVTQKDQCRNYSRNINITINDETKCLIEWCEKYNVDYDGVQSRLWRLRKKGISATAGFLDILNTKSK